MTSISRDDLQSALPDVTSPQKFSKLNSGAVINRDRWGIPHIKADDEYDLFFAQGFATAQDRLFQMDFDRMRCLGRVSEYVGAAGLAQDRLMRRRRQDRVAKLDYEVASDAAKNAMDAYADGVNAFIATTSALPVEYKLLDKSPEPWEPWHCVVVYKVRNTAEGSFQGKLWLSKLAAEIGPEAAARLTPGYQPGQLLTVPPGSRYSGAVLNAVDELRAVVEATSLLNNTDGGSNGWVISGERTASGLPLVAGDSHRGLEVPNVYYQVHLIGPDFAALGHSIPGVPMALHFCHNEHIGWGMTHGGADTQDLFVERFRDNGGVLEYLFKGDWLRADVTGGSIAVAGGAPEAVEIVETHHGPVIAGDPRRGVGIALADPGSREGTPWIDAAYSAMKAKSADEFEAAMEGWTDRVNNYPYADVHGNFGYTLRGRIPMRDAKNGFGPVPAWTGDYEWTGFIPPAELPRARNPETGWAVTCNQRIVDETYPHYLTNFFGPGYRAERVAGRIAALEGVKATVEDMSSIHADAVSLPALAFLSALKRLPPPGGSAGEAAALLTRWDGEVAADSSAAAIYEVAAGHLSAALSSHLYGSLATELGPAGEAGAEDHWRRHVKPAVVAAMEADDTAYLADGVSWGDLIAQSIERAVGDLTRDFGADMSAWRWGDLHRTGHQHPLAATFPDAADLLNPPSVETGGDSDTPFASGMKTGTFTTGSGSVNRYIHDPSDWSNGRWIVPLGASGHPGSSHFADQQEMWARVETIPQLWVWDEIEQAAENRQTLEPGAG